MPTCAAEGREVDEGVCAVAGTAVPIVRTVSRRHEGRRTVGMDMAALGVRE